MDYGNYEKILVQQQTQVWPEVLHIYLNLNQTLLFNLVSSYS